MVEYIIKSFLCQLLFILFYQLFLEKEKILHFNRFYLLLSLCLSLIIPNITLTIAGPDIIQSPAFNALVPAFSIAEPINEHVSLPIMLAIAYAIVFILLLIKYVRALISILSLIRTSAKSKMGNYNIVWLKTNSQPFTFLNFIFINKKDYEIGHIDQRLIQHEMTHADQYHTIDLFCLEFINIIFWFNPLIYVYNRAIRLNHEYLADAHIINNFGKVTEYQKLILTAVKTRQTALSTLTHGFSYLLTKKRFNMMTKKTKTTTKVTKVLGAIFLAAFITLSFSHKVSAQTSKEDITKTTKPNKKNSAPAPPTAPEPPSPPNPEIAPIPNTPPAPPPPPSVPLPKDANYYIDGKLSTLKKATSLLNSGRPVQVQRTTSNKKTTIRIKNLE